MQQAIRVHVRRLGTSDNEPVAPMRLYSRRRPAGSLASKGSTAGREEDGRAPRWGAIEGNRRRPTASPPFVSGAVVGSSDRDRPHRQLNAVKGIAEPASRLEGPAAPSSPRTSSAAPVARHRLAAPELQTQCRHRARSPAWYVGDRGLAWPSQGAAGAAGPP